MLSSDLPGREALLLALCLQKCCRTRSKAGLQHTLTVFSSTFSVHSRGQAIQGRAHPLALWRFAFIVSASQKVQFEKDGKNYTRAARVVFLHSAPPAKGHDLHPASRLNKRSTIALNSPGFKSCMCLKSICYRYCFLPE